MSRRSTCLICSATTIHCLCLRSYSHLLQFQSSSHHFQLLHHFNNHQIQSRCLLQLSVKTTHPFPSLIQLCSRIIVSENQAPPPIVASTVQSHPSIFGQVPVPSQSPIIPPSVQSPFQQLVTKEQMNLELSASSQGLFTNGSFMSCTFNFNLVQKQKHTKCPRVIYSDSEEY